MTQKFELDSKKMSGLTTEGAQAMLGKPKEFRKHLDLKVFRWIIGLFTRKFMMYKALDNIDIMKEVVPHIKYSPKPKLNHRQFKTLERTWQITRYKLFFISLLVKQGRTH